MFFLDGEIPIQKILNLLMELKEICSNLAKEGAKIENFGTILQEIQHSFHEIQTEIEFDQNNSIIFVGRNGAGNLSRFFILIHFFFPS